MATQQKIETILVNQLVLYLENPRHVPLGNEAETIAALCAKEDVLPLLKDIKKVGLSPLENFAIFPAAKRAANPRSQKYFAAEGNRRVCALKLLNDPDLAPAPLRKQVTKLASDWVPIRNVSAVIFKSFDEVRPWLQRIHNGQNGGIGRKQWNADQKTRFDGNSKNSLAQAILDYAEQENMLTAEQRERKLTTVERFISNPIFRDALGIARDSEEKIFRTRAKQDFDELMKKFVGDLADGSKVNSRMLKPAIEAYAKEVSSLPDASSPRIEGEPLVMSTGVKRAKGSRKTPKPPSKVKTVKYEQNIYDALHAFGNDKLSSLYYSICKVELERHTPLVAIGVWAFFESLSSCAGRADGTNFASFFSKHRLQTYGLDADSKTIRTVLDRITDFGNITKHHAISATFNGDQLNNDMMASKNLILKCIEEAKSRYT
jgi:hypothetical protein